MGVPKIIRHPYRNDPKRERTARTKLVGSRFVMVGMYLLGLGALNRVRGGFSIGGLNNWNRVWGYIIPKYIIRSPPNPYSNY